MKTNRKGRIPSTTLNAFYKAYTTDRGTTENENGSLIFLMNTDTKSTAKHQSTKHNTSDKPLTQSMCDDFILKTLRKVSIAGPFLQQSMQYMRKKCQHHTEQVKTENFPTNVWNQKMIPTLTTAIQHRKRERNEQAFFRGKSPNG